MRKLLIAGNWKMNCGPDETANLLNELKNQLSTISRNVEVLVCPPSISLTTAAANLEGTAIQLGAQNVHFEDNGAFTGEISTEMLSEIDSVFVIAGHSERRDYFVETDEMVNLKAKKALLAGIKPIVCVGEMLWQRKEGSHIEMVESQIEKALAGVDAESARNIVIAYEPIWAIGTGETATPGQAQEMHEKIRAKLEELFGETVSEKVQILYGGSMKPNNAEELLSQPDVDGGLIGGASLKAESFAEIIEIAEKIGR